MSTLSSVECCHPSERAADNTDTYICPDCQSVWTRHAFALAPARIQRAFLKRDISPDHFWSCSERAA